MGPVKKLNKVYKGENDNFREKAVTLLIINIVLGVFFLMFAAIRFAAESYVVAAGEVVVSLILLVNIIILFRGRYKTSSIISILLFTAAAFVIFIVQDHDQLDDLYKFSTYIISVVCVAPLLSYHIWQMISVAFAGLVGQALFYYFLLMPAALQRGETDFLGEFVISITFFFMASFFAVLVFRMQLSTIESSEREKNKAERSFARINSVIEDMRGSFNVGEKLLNAAAATNKSAGQISDNLTAIGDTVNELSSSTDISEDANEKIRTSGNTMKDKMDFQTEAINLSSAAVEQIINRISFVGSLAEQKLGQVEALNRASQRGEGKLEDSLEALKRLAASTDSILEIIEVIESISSRTNMLAMNAAIEAAHAGEAGRGFAVVAEEIRKLSEETDQNSEAIRKRIENNNQHFEESKQTSIELKNVFEELISEIGNIGTSLSDIVGSMNELSSGTDSISGSIANLQSSNDEVYSALGSMEDAVEKGSRSISGIREAVERTHENISVLKNLGGMIVAESSGLEEIGRENRNRIELLNEELKEINNG